MLPITIPAQSGSVRMLEGTVVDAAHRPISGASVQVQNEDTKAVESVLTDRVGHFAVHRLATGTDYNVRARHQGRESKVHEISKFNSKNPIVVELEVK